MTEVNKSLSPVSPPTTPARKGSSRRPRAGSHLPGQHELALQNIRTFLKNTTNYDSFPMSFRLIVLDTKLNVRKALQCLLLNGVVSAPMWNSEESKFAGMFTVSDIIHLIQYYYGVAASIDTATTDVETFKLESIPEIERKLGVATPPLIQEHPLTSLYTAAQRLIQTHARRVPLLDKDSETGQEVIVSVLTQYRLLKFVSINCSMHIKHLHKNLRELNIGTYVARSPEVPPNTFSAHSSSSTTPTPGGASPESSETTDPKSNPYYPLATVTLSTPVFDVVHMFSKLSISAVVILDANGIVVNIYETIDIITLVRLGKYHSLSMTIEEVLKLRPPDYSGCIICYAHDSLGVLLELIRDRRVHRLIVVESEEEARRGGKRGRLLGIITLSDVLRYLVGETKPRALTKDAVATPPSPMVAATARADTM